MLGCAFENLDNAVNGCLLKDLSGDFEDYDELQVASIVNNKLKYTSYYYYADDGITGYVGWHNEDFDYVGDTTTIPTGSAFWFISSGSAKAITVSGQVGKQEFTHTLKDKKAMICSAFPIMFNPNENCSWSGFEDYDEIQVSRIVNKKLKYTSYYYYADDGITGNIGWHNEDFDFIEDPICGVGQGFWLILGSASGHGFVETSPIK